MDTSGAFDKHLISHYQGTKKGATFVCLALLLFILFISKREEY